MDQLDSRRTGKQGLCNIGRALLVTEQTSVPDDREAAVRKRPQHLLGPLQREERITISPDELHGNVDAPVQFDELIDVSSIEATQHLDGGSTAFARRVKWAEEELVELTVEERAVDEAAPEHEFAPSQPRLAGDPTQRSSHTGRVPDCEKRTEPPVEAMGLFRVDECHGPHPNITSQCVASDQPAAVIPTTATSSSPSKSTTRRTVVMCCSTVSVVSAPNRLDPAPGRSMMWHVTCELKHGRSVRKVAPLTGHP